MNEPILSVRLLDLFEDVRCDEMDYGPLVAEVRVLENEVSDLRGFIDGMKRHVLSAAKMYGAEVSAEESGS